MFAPRKIVTHSQIPVKTNQPLAYEATLVCMMCVLFKIVGGMQLIDFYY